MRSRNALFYRYVAVSVQMTATTEFLDAFGTVAAFFIFARGQYHYAAVRLFAFRCGCNAPVVVERGMDRASVRSVHRLELYLAPTSYAFIRLATRHRRER